MADRVRPGPRYLRLSGCVPSRGTWPSGCVPGHRIFGRLGASRAAVPPAVRVRPGPRYLRLSGCVPGRGTYGRPGASRATVPSADRVRPGLWCLRSLRSKCAPVTVRPSQVLRTGSGNTPPSSIIWTEAPGTRSGSGPPRSPVTPSSRPTWVAPVHPVRPGPVDTVPSHLSRSRPRFGLAPFAGARADMTVLWSWVEVSVAFREVPGTPVLRPGGSRDIFRLRPGRILCSRIQARYLDCLVLVTALPWVLIPFPVQFPDLCGCPGSFGFYSFPGGLHTISGRFGPQRRFGRLGTTLVLVDLRAPHRTTGPGSLPRYGVDQSTGGLASVVTPPVIRIGPPLLRWPVRWCRYRCTVPFQLGYWLRA